VSVISTLQEAIKKPTASLRTDLNPATFRRSANYSVVESTEFVEESVRYPVPVHRDPMDWEALNASCFGEPCNSNNNHATGSSVERGERRVGSSSSRHPSPLLQPFTAGRNCEHGASASSRIHRSPRKRTHQTCRASLRTHPGGSTLFDEY
jgi:hypothetical protein